jgi:F0F1-type ATP synthase membrane subunit b/b'
MTPTAIHGDELTEQRADIHDLLEGLRELVVTARSMPLSNSVIVNRDEALEYLEDIVSRLPEEVRQARWLLKEREEFLERARREADEILAAARSRAEGMVQRTEVVKEAQRLARMTRDHAEAEARQIRNQAEDYVDNKLANFELTLERTLQIVQKGRRRLQAIAPGEPAPEVLPAEPVVFDQDA